MKATMQCPKADFLAYFRHPCGYRLPADPKRLSGSSYQQRPKLIPFTNSRARSNVNLSCMSRDRAAMMEASVWRDIERLRPAEQRRTISKCQTNRTIYEHQTSL